MAHSILSSALYASTRYSWYVPRPVAAFLSVVIPTSSWTYKYFSCHHEKISPSILISLTTLASLGSSIGLIYCAFKVCQAFNLGIYHQINLIEDGPNFAAQELVFDENEKAIRFRRREDILTGSTFPYFLLHSVDLGLLAYDLYLAKKITLSKIASIALKAIALLITPVLEMTELWRFGFAENNTVVGAPCYAFLIKLKVANVTRPIDLRNKECSICLQSTLGKTTTSFIPNTAYHTFCLAHWMIRHFKTHARPCIFLEEGLKLVANPKLKEIDPGSRTAPNSELTIQYKRTENAFTAMRCFIEFLYS